MNTPDRTEEIIASLPVVDEANEIKQVIVSQDNVPHYSGEESYYKHFRLESVYGEVVYKTEDPNIFKLVDGAILRRRKR